MNEAMATTYQPLTARRSITLVHSAPLGPLDRERGGRRLLNIIVATAGLVVAAPLMLIIAALVKLTSRGPVLFTQIPIRLDRRALSRSAGNTRRGIDLRGKPLTLV